VVARRPEVIRPRNGLAAGLALGALTAFTALNALTTIHCAPRSSSSAPDAQSSEPGELPGIAPRPAALREKLAAALASKGAGYKPRTEHTAPGGAPKYTNRLILEASPYLLQHAHNPVDWYPWGDEAFEAARRENKPVFLSVGYSTCHWCHVMERESFEDAEVAELINRHFIAIKVDREERPDVDAIYMNAVFMLGGSGGWPMTVVLTPDRQPFFAGTYFPARDGDRGQKRGLLSILRELSTRYASERDELVARAADVTKKIAQGLAAPAGGEIPTLETVDLAVALLGRSFDDVYGGFGGAPKFPRPTDIELLLRHHRRTGAARSLEMATKTLDAMAAGGIFDHVGGGFHRYATDKRWLVPHFEKMLYDNAQLAAAYLEAYQATGEARYASVARRVLDYVIAEMTSPDGAFYSATDADSEGEEGKFFVWTPDAIKAVVGEGRARSVNAYFAVTPQGNFEGKTTILSTPRPLSAVAKDLGVPEAALEKEIEAARALLYEARKKRVPPLRDEKILASWNGLMVGAMARGAFVLKEPRYLEAARRAADFLLQRRTPDTNKRLARNAAAPERGEGFLDDYAFFIGGLLDLHHASSEPRWLEAAIGLESDLEARFWDASAGGFFLSGDGAEKLLAREKPDYDGAEPSGNSMAALNLCRLSALTSNHRYRPMADKTLAAFSGSMKRSPRSLPKMLTALELCASEILEVAIVSPRAEAANRAALATKTEALMQKLRGTFLPGYVLVTATEGEDVDQKAALAPFVAQKIAKNKTPTAYVCRGGTCKQPATDPELFARQLGEAR
jgi:hypothetical protein